MFFSRNKSIDKEKTNVIVEKSFYLQIALYFPSKKQCGCIETSYEFDTAFKYEKKCQCSLNNDCSNSDEWFVMVVSNTIDLIDAEVGEQ